LLLEDVEEEISNWRTDYNEHRPDSGLGNLASKEFAATCQAMSSLCISTQDTVER
jgi:hypothetical protein